VADRGMLTRYGGYGGNKIAGANQNWHCCLTVWYWRIKGQRKKTLIKSYLVFQVGRVDAAGQPSAHRKKKIAKKPIGNNLDRLRTIIITIVIYQ